MRLYEAMFLFDPTFATDFGNVDREVGRILERAGAELVSCRKWDERRLAYEVEGRKRGTYVLTYFRGEPSRIGSIERDVQLSEDVLRVLVLRADDVPQEELSGVKPARAERTEGGPDADDRVVAPVGARADAGVLDAAS